MTSLPCGCAPPEPPVTEYGASCRCRGCRRWWKFTRRGWKPYRFRWANWIVGGH